MFIGHLKVLKRVRINGYAYLCLLMVSVCLFLAYVTHDVTHDSKGYLFADENHLNLDPLSKSFKNPGRNPGRRLSHVLSDQSKMILIVTLWRSGSSWLGQLLSKSPNSFYLYEPIHMLIKNSKHNLGLNIPEAVKLSTVKHLFQCGISSEFLNHYKNWTEIFPKMVCYEKPNKTCPALDAANVTEECVSASYRIIKTVRLNLESVEEMLTLPSFRTLKVIFLTRDPRGTMKSMISISKEKKIWNVSSVEICTRLRSNILMYKTLKSLFPDRLFFVRYEDIAIDPIGKALDLWKFLESSTSEELPEEWIYFLKESQTSKNYTEAMSNPFDVHKRSTQNWQLWREEIMPELFVDVQSNCKDILDTLGYRYFDSLDELRNMSTSSALVHTNCIRLPCL